MRAPFNVAIAAFRKLEKSVEYLVLQRSDRKYWQVIAGGGENSESILDAARRESLEEALIPSSCVFSKLDTLITVPANEFAAHKTWPKGTYVIPQYYFSVDATGVEIKTSDEHLDFRWLEYHAAIQTLHWESDQIALYELQERLLNH